jgi:hypothetical protein
MVLQIVLPPLVVLVVLEYLLLVEALLAKAELEEAEL